MVKIWITSYIFKRQNQGCMVKASSGIRLHVGTEELMDVVHLQWAPGRREDLGLGDTHSHEFLHFFKALMSSIHILSWNPQILKYSTTLFQNGGLRPLFSAYIRTQEIGTSWHKWEKNYPLLPILNVLLESKFDSKLHKITQNRENVCQPTARVLHRDYQNRESFSHLCAEIL